MIIYNFIIIIYNIITLYNVLNMIHFWLVILLNIQNEDSTLVINYTHIIM